VVNASPDELEIDTAIRCVFASVRDEDAGETLTLPQWELVR
jgi:hypothetical protein